MIPKCSIILKFKDQEKNKPKQSNPPRQEQKPREDRRDDKKQNKGGRQNDKKDRPVYREREPSSDDSWYEDKRRR